MVSIAETKEYNSSEVFIGCKMIYRLADIHRTEETNAWMRRNVMCAKVNALLEIMSICYLKVNFWIFTTVKKKLKKQMN